MRQASPRTYVVFTEETGIALLKDAPRLDPDLLVDVDVVLLNVSHRVEFEDRFLLKRGQWEAGPDRHVRPDIEYRTAGETTLTPGEAVKPREMLVTEPAQRKSTIQAKSYAKSLHQWRVRKDPRHNGIDILQINKGVALPQDGMGHAQTYVPPQPEGVDPLKEKRQIEAGSIDVESGNHAVAEEPEESRNAP